MSAAKLSYWDDRYQKDNGAFDWYQRYSGLKEIFAEHILKTDKILVAGCGQANMTRDMYNDGYRGGIWNVDHCRTVIERMKGRNDDLHGVHWEQDDIMELDYKDGTFDVCINKAAFDAQLTGESSPVRAKKICMEASRVLKPEGTFIVVSFHHGENMLRYLEDEAYGWEVTTEEKVLKPVLPDACIELDLNAIESYHYIYICKKTGVPAIAEEGEEK